ncbi:hypothetical protein [Allonocardiopsis opalescens]|uniref:Septum formation initiator n=1 Tax=Allonocardiopsis opalescens TaxID=1144618 RepID=A0A2T0Q443_9ACTN|nr:hypothetical protein [Allonocardiopsis opalescens]PRX98481.1 hypothetical protein CLV72_10458 [Allonocardiopsis opalescens]
MAASTTRDDAARQAARAKAGAAPARGPARAPARPKAAPARRGTAARPAPRQPQRTPPRVPFVLLVLGLMAGALVSLLMLRAVLAQDAFTLSQLRTDNRELQLYEERLRQEVVYAESPDALADRAAELGMEPGEEPLFVNLDTGRVEGEPGTGGPQQ